MDEKLLQLAIEALELAEERIMELSQWANKPSGSTLEALDAALTVFRAVKESE